MSYKGLLNANSSAVRSTRPAPSPSGQLFGSARMLVGVLVISLLAGWLATTVNNQLIGGYQFMASILLVLYAVVVGCVVYVIFRDGKALFYLHPLLYILLPFFVGYFLRAIYALFFSLDVMVGFSQLDAYHYLTFALLIVLIGTVAILAGYLAPFGNQVASRIPKINNVIYADRLQLISLAVYLFGAAIFSVWLVTTDEFRFSIDVITSGKLRSNYEFLRVGYRFMYLGTLMGAIHHFGVKRSWYWWLMLGSSLMIPFIISSRKDVLLIIIGVLVIRTVTVGRIHLRTLIVTGVLLLLTSIAMLGLRNENEFDVSLLVEAYQPAAIVDMTVGASWSFADIVSIAHIARHLDNGGSLLWGRIITDLPARFIPRALWPNKPENVGIQLAALFFNDELGVGSTSQFGIPPSLIAELFWNFHLPGVLVGAFIFGVFCRTLYAYFQTHLGNPWVVLLYALALVYVFEQAMTSFPQLSQRHLTMFLPAVALVLILTHKKRYAF